MKNCRRRQQRKDAIEKAKIVGAMTFFEEIDRIQTNVEGQFSLFLLGIIRKGDVVEDRNEYSRFAYQIMAGLSARISKLVEFRLGYRFRSSRGWRSMPTVLKQASGSGFDPTLKNGGHQRRMITIPPSPACC